MKFFVQTFGCIQNTSDSERIKNYFLVKGDEESKNWKESDVVIINTCMIRQSAENRAYGLIDNINKWNKNPLSLRDISLKKGNYLSLLFLREEVLQSRTGGFNLLFQYPWI